MARKTTISKEVILEAALTMLIRDGYATINIKTLAAEIGCSTQPIVWHFENMEGLRGALAGYAGEYAMKQAAGKQTAGKKPANAVTQFEQMGKAYIHMAIKEPNLFKYLYLGERPLGKPFGLKGIAGQKEGREMLVGIARETGLTEVQAARCIQNTIFYSHGIATMVATGVFYAPEKKLLEMIHDASESFVRKERG